MLPSDVPLWGTIVVLVILGSLFCAVLVGLIRRGRGGHRWGWPEPPISEAERARRRVEEVGRRHEWE
jgi:hypothetical protein